MREYLLSYRTEDDKSGFLAIAGYDQEDWTQLESDLRRQIEECEAQLVRITQYGEMYEIKGQLSGPNGKRLDVITVWIQLYANGETRFVTLFPNKEITR